jgi:drug/metabolite transporter (DMT)-like permease
MDAIDVAAALTSAVLHAGWNAAVKASREPARAMTAQMLLSAVLVLPGLLWSGLPPLAAWPWIAGSTLMSVVTVTALLRAYELGGFGLVYPVARAIAVVLVVPLVALFAGSLPGAAALGGIAVIALSLALLAWDAALDRGVPLPALAWIFTAGVGAAGYVLCDGQWAVAVPAAVASVASYLLILWVWGHAPVAPAAALRDTSAGFAILIAVVWLKEPFTRTRVLAVLLTAAAVPLLRLG